MTDTARPLTLVMPADPRDRALAEYRAYLVTLDDQALYREFRAQHDGVASRRGALEQMRRDWRRAGRQRDWWGTHPELQPNRLAMQITDAEDREHACIAERDRRDASAEADMADRAATRRY